MASIPHKKKMSLPENRMVLPGTAQRRNTLGVPAESTTRKLSLKQTVRKIIMVERAFALPETLGGDPDLIINRICKIFRLDGEDRTNEMLQPILPWLREKSTLLKEFNSQKLCSLMRTVEVATYKPDQVIIHQGDIGDCFYILTSGYVAVYVKSYSDGSLGEPQKDILISKGSKERSKFGKEVATMGTGRCFGEVTFMSGGERTATIIADDQAMLLAFSKDNYDRYATKQGCCELLERTKFVSEYPLFKAWPNSYKNLLSENLQLREVRFGETVVSQGSPVNSVFFVKSGQAKLTMDPRRHNAQFPMHMDGQSGAASSDEEDDDSTDLVRLRFKPMSVYSQRQVKQESGYYTSEALKRAMDICTIGPGGMIGDIEAIMDLGVYTTSVMCEQTLVMYEIDKYSFVRVIVKKSPDTFDKMRKMIKDKIEFRSDSIRNGIPIYRALLESFSKTKSKDEREKLIQLYAGRRADQKVSGDPFYIRLNPVRRSTPEELEEDTAAFNKPGAAKDDPVNKGKEGWKRAKKGTRFVGTILAMNRKAEREKKAAQKDAPAKQQYTAEDYKDLKKKMQTLGKQSNTKRMS